MRPANCGIQSAYQRTQDRIELVADGVGYDLDVAAQHLHAVSKSLHLFLRFTRGATAVADLPKHADDLRLAAIEQR